MRPGARAACSLRRPPAGSPLLIPIQSLVDTGAITKHADARLAHLHSLPLSRPQHWWLPDRCLPAQPLPDSQKASTCDSHALPKPSTEIQVGRQQHLHEGLAVVHPAGAGGRKRVPALRGQRLALVGDAVRQAGHACACMGAQRRADVMQRTEAHRLGLTAVRPTGLGMPAHA